MPLVAIFLVAVILTLLPIYKILKNKGLSKLTDLPAYVIDPPTYLEQQQEKAQLPQRAKSHQVAGGPLVFKSQATTCTITGMITIDDFAKLDIRLGKILSAEKLPETDKLVKFSIDLGEAEPRHIIGGFAVAYPDPTVLVGQEVPVIANLEPRSLRGEMSHGMILAASGPDGLPVALHPDKEVDPGTKLK